MLHTVEYAQRKRWAHTGPRQKYASGLSVNKRPDPEVADMLVIGESVWQRGARMARSPVFGAAGVVYLVSAWVVVGAATSAPPADGSMAHGAGIIRGRHLPRSR